VAQSVTADTFVRPVHPHSKDRQVKLLTYRVDGAVRFGALREDAIIDVSTRLPDTPSIRSVLEAGALARVAEVVAGVAGPDRRPADVDLLPVVPDPGKIICAGVNYRAHRDEAGRGEAQYPTLFTRFADTQIAAGADALRPAESDRFDYEGELAVVIGNRGSHIPETEAMPFVAGYSCYNDFTARDWQRHSSQWTPGKNFPRTGAFGPCLITADEIDDVASLKLETRVNGEIRQSASVADLIFSIPSLISYTSRFTPLSPGDVLVTGTPGGVGMFREPPTFLKPGDVVEVEIDGVGLLRNVVASA
jgi:2-keto-4-pentenoate hydratase/2-oxohepta-3-ene-1,7-dioic acid hydratase in catechol pathway